MPAPQPKPNGDPDFVYVIYIKAPVENVWAALTDGETVRAWWGHTRQESTFQPGDPIVYRRNGGVDVRGEILEREAPGRLAYTFHVEGPGPQHDEGPTLVTYELTFADGMTMLQVTHSRFQANSKVRIGVSKGWPSILSKLKTVLETGSL